jgi:hypothetical protein
MSIPINSHHSSSGEGLQGRDKTARSKTVGKLDGRRVSLLDGMMIFPESQSGRSLVSLITGHYTAIGNEAVDLDSLHASRERVSDLRDLLNEILAIDNPKRLEALALLNSYGVREPAASELAADDWCTPERISKWWTAVCADPQYQWANNRPALLVGILRDHAEPPAHVHVRFVCDMCGGVERGFSNSTCICEGNHEV